MCKIMRVKKLENNMNNLPKTRFQWFLFREFLCHRSLSVPKSKYYRLVSHVKENEGKTSIYSTAPAEITLKILLLVVIGPSGLQQLWIITQG